MSLKPVPIQPVPVHTFSYGVADRGALIRVPHSSSCVTTTGAISNKAALG